MNINYFYFIDKNTNNPEKIIFLAVRYKNSRFVIHSKERIEPKYWDDKNRKVKRSYTGHSELNYFLESFMNHVKNTVRQFRALNPIIKFEDLRVKVKNVYKDKPQNDFFDALNTYLKVKKPTVSRSFLLNFDSLKKQLQKYEKIKNITIDFDSISMSFLDNLQNYLINNLKLQNNTIKHKIRFLKMFLRWCNDRGITDNNQFEKFKPVSGNDTSKFSLTSEEVKSLINIELEEDLDQIRDIFLFQLYTGQRIGDILKFDYADANNNIWELTQHKTKEKPKVPLCKYAYEILKKHDGKLPNKSSKTINRNLKVIAKKAGLDETITINKYIGSELQIERYKKHEKLSTHIARHTFETVMTIAKVNQQTIDAITGHKSQTMSSKYYHPETNELLNIINNVFDDFLSK